jgi:DNA-binding IclR family transcriptional regulator
MNPTTHAHEPDDRLGRAVAEYREMPGLSLTPPQAARLWGVETADANRILQQLASAGFLTRTSTGSYVLRGD